MPRTADQSEGHRADIRLRPKACKKFDPGKHAPAIQRPGRFLRALHSRQRSKMETYSQGWRPLSSAGYPLATSLASPTAYRPESILRFYRGLSLRIDSPFPTI